MMKFLFVLCFILLVFFFVIEVKLENMKRRAEPQFLVILVEASKLTGK